MSTATARPRGLVGRLSGGHLLTLAAGLLGAACTFAALRAIDDTVDVAVARHDLPPGTRVQRSDLTAAAIRADGELLRRLVRADDAEELVGRVVVDEIDGGDPVLMSSLRSAAAPDGQRAMSFAVSESRAAGGAIEAGDRVDVLATDRDGDVGYALVDAEVLARSDAGDGAPIRSGGDELTLTLAVDADGARRLAAALAADDITVVRATGAKPIDAVVWFDTAVTPPAEEATVDS